MSAEDRSVRVPVPLDITAAKADDVLDAVAEAIFAGIAQQFAPAPTETPEPGDER